MQIDNGLEKVVAAETRLSHVDGLAGELIISGFRLDELVANRTFEDVAGLLLAAYAETPSDIQTAIGEARTRVTSRTSHLLPDLADMPLFDAMRTAISTLSDSTDLQATLDLVAAPGTLLAQLIRQSSEQKPIEPDPSLGHAEDMLRMAGLNTSAAAIAGLNAYLISVIDHGLNASTFTARVVASTDAGLVSSVTAALGALKGPLHGGAPGPVLDMLDAVGTPANARTWIEGELSAGRRLMGFGHRIYRVRDPRADALKSALAGLRSDRLELAGAVEREALAALTVHKPDRKLETNVEFYTAVLLEALGFPRETFTAVFASGRTAGWVAHALEQAATGRLIRPQSHYVGPLPQQAA